MSRTAKLSRPATNLFDHLRELRTRLIVCIIVLVVAGVVVYAFYEPLLTLLRSPLKAPLYYTSPAGSFSFVMKICFTGALAITIPVIIYNLIMFVQPAFDKSMSRRGVYVTTICSALLAVTGAAFAFIFIIPDTLRFFGGFQVAGLSSLISADSYLKFVTNVIITFVIFFQLPLIISFIDTIKPFQPGRLLKLEKWVALGSLIIALLVPFAFDVTTTLLVALPIILLYNIAIIPVFIRHAYRKHQQTRLVSKWVESDELVPIRPLEDWSFIEDMVDDLTTQTPIELEPTLMVATIQKSTRAGMDIKPLKTKPQPVVPAVWVHRVADPIPRDMRAPVISDIRPISRANLA